MAAVVEETDVHVCAVPTMLVLQQVRSAVAAASARVGSVRRPREVDGGFDSLLTVCPSADRPMRTNAARADGGGMRGVSLAWVDGVVTVVQDGWTSSWSRSVCMYTSNSRTTAAACLFSVASRHTRSHIT